MTKATDAIVTELGNGPSTARELSQRLDGIGYAAIRQALSRLAKAGVVTKPARGVYALDCDKAAAPVVTEHCDKPATLHCDMTEAQVIAGRQVFVDHFALDNPGNPEAWA